MEKFIHKYLSQNYQLVLTEIPKYSVFKFDGDALYKIEDNSKYRSFESPNLLLRELKTVFCLSDDELKPIVFSWAKTLKEDVNLDRYWEYIDSLLPVARHVAAQTMGLDIVSVQPMPRPRGELLYMDYHYGVDPIDEIMSATTMSATTGRRSPSNRNVEIILSDRDSDLSRYKAMSKWNSLINLTNSRNRE